MSYEFYISPEDYETAKKNGIAAKTLEARIRRLGWSKEKALNKKVRQMTDRSKWSEVAKKNGISYETFLKRVEAEWSEEDAATRAIVDPKIIGERRRTIPKKYVELAEKNGISYPSFRSRVYRGWSLEEAATTPVLSNTEVLKRARKKSSSRKLNDLVFMGRKRK